MSRHVPFRQADVQRAVAGAVRGGWPIGSFGVEITRAGVIRILPSSALPSKDEDPLDAEMRELRASYADGRP